ncbi:J domain-containing protein [Candidatus Babeliales bacterium]|nr:J domain-containing protein [Candidatus Babeliales bacterium]
MIFNHILAKLRTFLAVFLAAVTLPLGTVYSAASSSNGYTSTGVIGDMTQLTVLQDWDIKAFCKARGLDIAEMWDTHTDLGSDDFEVLLKALPTIQAAIKKLFADYATSDTVHEILEISKIRDFLQKILLLNFGTKIYDEDGTELDKQVCSLQGRHLDQELIDNAKVVMVLKTSATEIVKKIGFMLATYFEQSFLNQRNQNEDDYIFSVPRVPLVLGMCQDHVVIASFPVIKQSSFKPFIADYYLEHELLKDATSTFVRFMCLLFAICSVVVPTVGTKFPSIVDEFCASEYAQLLADEPFAVIGLDSTATEQEVRSQCRKLALTMHPDKGGDAEQWLRIQEACEEIKSSFELSKEIDEVKTLTGKALL